MIANNVLFSLLILLSVIVLGFSAPATCRSCKGACHQNNGTTTASDGVVDFDTGPGNRTKRESFIEQRSCSTRFQLEMILIPLSIAMIPVGLCALLLCVCFCGPKDSRGKLPDNFLGKKLSRDHGEDKDSELEYKDGCVQRKDSKKTRFSTNVAIIEARRVSMDNEVSSVHSYDGTFVAANETRDTDVSEDAFERQNPKKRTRFDDNISIMGQDSVDPQETIAPADEERAMSAEGAAKKLSWLNKLGQTKKEMKENVDAETETAATDVEVEREVVPVENKS